MNLLTFGIPADTFHPSRIEKEPVSSLTGDPAGDQGSRRFTWCFITATSPQFLDGGTAGFGLQYSESSLIKPKMSEAEEQSEISSQFPSTKYMRKETALVMQRGCWETRATYFNKAVPIQTEGDASKFRIWLREGAISLVEQRMSQSQVTEALHHRSNLHLLLSLISDLSVYVAVFQRDYALGGIRNSKCTQ